MPAPLPGRKAASWHWPFLVLLLTVRSLLPHSKNQSETIEMSVQMHLYVQSAAGFVSPLDGQRGRAMLWVSLASFLTILAHLLYSPGIISKLSMSTRDNTSFITFSKVCSVSWVCLY